MYFTDDSLLPENQDPLIITAAPYGPMWLPADYPGDIAASWDAQVQKAVDCYNAGASRVCLCVMTRLVSGSQKLEGSHLDYWNDGILE
jgi:hypothetical protein